MNPRRKALWITVPLAALVFVHAAIGAEVGTGLHLNDTRVERHAPNGALLWTVGLSDSSPASIVATAAGGALVDGEFLLDHTGRLVARLHSAPTDDAKAGIAGQAWEQPVSLHDPDQLCRGVGPLVNAAGDAWILLLCTGATGQVILASRSNGHTTQWSIPEQILATGNFIGAASATIDNADVITLAYRTVADSLNRIEVLRYLPGNGWQAAETVHSDSAFFQSIDTASDDSGNVVIVFDPDGARVSSVVYDAASASWGTAQPVSPPALTGVAAVTLLQNRSGSSVYAAYWVPEGTSKGIYIRRFSAAAGGWQATALAPASRIGTLPGFVGPDAIIAGAVDDSGVLTIPFYVQITLPSQARLWVMLAVRRQASAWQGPALLTYHLDDPPLLMNFADADTSSGGDVMIVVKQHNAGSGATRLMALHYDAATGLWRKTADPYSDLNGPEQRARFAYSLGPQGLASYADFSGLPVLTSRLFGDAAWLPGAVSFPGSPFANFQELAADGPDYVIWFGDDLISGSWLYSPN